MVTIEEIETCEACGENSVLSMHRVRIYCNFYVSPYLPFEKLRHVIEGRVIEHEEYWEYIVKCPACGSWESDIGLTGIELDCPRDYCTARTSGLIKIPIDEIKKFVPDAIISEDARARRGG